MLIGRGKAGGRAAAPRPRNDPAKKNGGERDIFPTCESPGGVTSYKTHEFGDQIQDDGLLRSRVLPEFWVLLLCFTFGGGIMRIKVRDIKVIKAIKKLEGIDIVLKNVEDAKKALRLILRRTEISKTPDYAGLKDIAVAQVLEQPTSAVENLISYEIEFILADERYTEMEIALIKELQGLFEKL
jgi:hypothetical protein